MGFSNIVGAPRAARLTPPRWLVCLASAWLVALGSVIAAQPAHAGGAIDEAEAASGPPFEVPVFMSSRPDECYDRGNNAAIRRLIAHEQDRINRRGGIAGRPVHAIFMDDERDEAKSAQNVVSALGESNTLAMIGMSGSTRPKSVFDKMGKEIGASGIPFLSDVSVNTIFADYQNVFTTRASQDDDRMPIVEQFVKKIGYQRIGFIGVKDFFGSVSSGEALAKLFADRGGLHGNELLTPADGRLVADDITTAVQRVKAADPDIIYLGVGGANAAQIISALVSSGFTPGLFLASNVDNVPDAAKGSYPNAIYGIDWETPPEVYNNRIRTRLGQNGAQDWIFEGAKNGKAPGWKDGSCKERAPVEFPDAFAADNLKAITVGSQFADMLSLVVTAARTGEKTTDIGRLRRRILEHLANSYAAGKGEFRGTFDNWSFVSGTRAAARTPFIVILPQGLGRTQLAPLQFMRTKDGGLRQIETLYVDIDLVKLHRVDENGNSFYADFYLAMRDAPDVSIERLDFTNAYIDTETGGRQLTIETVHPGGKSDVYPTAMKIYKVSGRFLFQPWLGHYPFDSQRFSIDISPKNGLSPFIVQPPPLALRDQGQIADGWDPKAQFVGYERDSLPVVDAFTHAPTAVSFFKTSYAWQMQRQTTDYFLRVAVPLAFILFVAYLSIFIPRTNFEAIVTIQVTALLSAVALYLSLPQLDSNAATLSDKAFVFAYMVISLMIGVSILRVMDFVTKRPSAERTLAAIHLAAIPLIVAAGAYYVYAISAASR